MRPFSRQHQRCHEIVILSFLRYNQARLSWKRIIYLYTSDRFPTGVGTTNSLPCILGGLGLFLYFRHDILNRVYAWSGQVFIVRI